jgi:hypothetical protein
MTQEVVLDLIKSTFEGKQLEQAAHSVFFAAGEGRQWAVDRKGRAEIDAVLAARGYPPARIEALAYVRGADQINAIDRRIASYEGRRAAIVREIGRYNEALARKLNTSRKIIDGEFTEAAE